MNKIVESVAEPKLEAAGPQGGPPENPGSSPVPDSYGDLLREYAAVRRGGVGLLNLSSRGRVRVTGSEAIQFLNGLVTNDMKTLVQGHWMPAVFPNVQGRLIANVRIMRFADHQLKSSPIPVFLIDTEAPSHEAMLKTIARFSQAGDFHVEDITANSAHISLQGQKAGAVIETVVGHKAGLPPGQGLIETTWQDRDLIVVRASHTPEVGFDVITDLSTATELWAAFLKAGAWPVGLQAQEILRIEAGIPRHGIDMDETNVVSETNLDDAVSYTKGCYVGQEIVARVKYRGHVAKKLTGLVFEQASKPEAGSKLQSLEGQEAGWLTSVAYSPELGRTIALGYVRHKYLTPGTRVQVAANDKLYDASVSELPFALRT